MNIQTTLTSSITASPEDALTRFLLSELRVAVIETRRAHNQLLATGVSLNAGLFDVEHALLHLHETGVLTLLSSQWWLE